MDIMQCINCLLVFLELWIFSKTFNTIVAKYNTQRYVPISPEVPPNFVIRGATYNNIYMPTKALIAFWFGALSSVSCSNPAGCIHLFHPEGGLSQQLALARSAR